MLVVNLASKTILYLNIFWIYFVNIDCYLGLVEHFYWFVVNNFWFLLLVNFLKNIEIQGY
jgi:hypothetical protein